MQKRSRSFLEFLQLKSRRPSGSVPRRAQRQPCRLSSRVPVPTVLREKRVMECSAQHLCPVGTTDLMIC